MKLGILFFASCLLYSAVHAQIRQPEGVRSPDSDRASAECSFASYAYGDEKGAILAKRAKDECLRNIDARRSGQPASRADYEMWYDHRQLMMNQRNAAKPTNCIRTGPNTVQCN